MLKLPVCPHCGAVYTYREVSNMKKGIQLCYHCQKKFSVHKSAGRTILMTSVCVALIIANTAIMYSSNNFIPVVMMIADAVFVTAAVLLIPLTVRFKPEKMTKAEKRKKNQRSGK